MRKEGGGGGITRSSTGYGCVAARRCFCSLINDCCCCCCNPSKSRFTRELTGEIREKRGQKPRVFINCAPLAWKSVAKRYYY